MIIRQITSALEEFAPLALQDGYDNAGLQIGLAKDADATGALLCLDVTESVIDEAIDKGINLIISHHPLLFRPLKCIAGRDYIERSVTKAIKHDITIYSAHTNLDSAPGGVNHMMAERLGLCDLQWLNAKGDAGGEGLIGTLSQPMPTDAFVQLVKTTFNMQTCRVNQWSGNTVQRVALCGGAGAFLMSKAAQMGADAFLTGEIGYHRFFGYEDTMLLMEMGHYESEQYTMQLLQRIVQNICPSLPITITGVNTNPVLNA